jgi:hypothetical protein
VLPPHSSIATVLSGGENHMLRVGIVDRITLLCSYSTKNTHVTLLIFITVSMHVGSCDLGFA